MRLLALTASKLFSLSDRPITINLDKRGLVLVTGANEDGSSNGSGKSTIANKAIIWTLFGQTAGGIRGDDVVNRHIGGAETYGEIIFDDDMGERYKIRRSRNPATLTFEKFNLMEKVWTNHTFRNQSDTQDTINATLGRDLSTFLQTDFFGQGRERSFLSLTPAQQVEVLEQILPINEITTWSKFAKESKKDVSNILESLAQQSMYSGGITNQLNTDLYRLRDRSEKFEKEKEIKIQGVNKKILEFEETTTGMKEEHDEVIAELREIQDWTDNALADLDSSMTTTEENLQTSREKISEHVANIAALKATRAGLADELVDVKENECPVCNQVIPTELSNELFTRQHEIRGKMLEIDESVGTLDMNRAGWVVHTSGLEQSLDVLSHTKAAALNDIRRRQELMDQKRQLEHVVATEQDLKDHLKHAKDEENPYTEVIEEKKETLDAHQETLNLIAERSDKWTEEKGTLDFWAEAFGKDFKTYLFKKACPFLQSRTAHHLKGLNNDQFQVEFTTTRMLKSGDERIGFNVNVSSSTGGEGFDSMSGGEQQMISFAVGLALADLAETQIQGSSHFLILDEPFMALDEKNCESLVNYLTNALSSKRETILLISNEENLKSLVPNNIHVQKIGGITSVRP